MPTAKPTLVIPTGFESQQREIERKRAIAKAILEQGMATDTSMTSPLQVLGKFAQTWAGSSMGRDAEKKATGLDQEILTSYLGKQTEFQNDVKTMPPEQIVAKWQKDPMMSEQIKPFVETMTAKMKQDQTLVRNGPQWSRMGGLEGTMIPSGPGDDIIVENGQAKINPLKLTRDMAAQGFPMGGTDPTAIQNPVTSMPWPMAGGGQGQGQPPAPMAPPRGPGATEGMGSPQGNVKIIGGQPYYNINGKWYDNPEGR